MIGTKEEIIEFLQKEKEGKIYEITAKSKKSLRSIAQNRYYFGVVIEYIADYIGLKFNFEKLELHEQLKKDFGLDSSADLTTEEFSFYIGEIRAFFYEKFNLYIPKPNEAEFLGSIDKYI